MRARDGGRHARDRQVAARARARRLASRRGARAGRPLHRVRRGHHVPAARRRSCATSPATIPSARSASSSRTSSAAAWRRALIAGAVGAGERRGLAGGDGLGVPPPLRDARRRPAAGRRRRRHPLGRADAARPPRVRRRLLERRADPAAVPRAARISSTRARHGRRRGAAPTLVSLDPLDADDGGEPRRRPARTTATCPSRVRRRIVETAEGNPLFVEQMLAMLADDPDAADDAVPPTIQALLAARIDRLEPEERAVVQRASVEGRLFHRGAVAELLRQRDGDGLGGDLLALVRKEFVRPDRSLFPGDDGFRFNHVLIRDVAYASMPKELRADLHVRLAGLARGARPRRADRARRDRRLPPRAGLSAAGRARPGRRRDARAPREGRPRARTGGPACDRPRGVRGRCGAPRARVPPARGRSRKSGLELLPDLGWALRDTRRRSTLRTRSSTEAVEEATPAG